MKKLILSVLLFTANLSHAQQACMVDLDNGKSFILEVSKQGNSVFIQSAEIGLAGQCQEIIHSQELVCRTNKGGTIEMTLALSGGRFTWETDSGRSLRGTVSCEP